MFLLSGQFKANKDTNNGLSQMQQELLCESQAKRLPCPEHTSSVHLLTEDGATEAAGCAQEGRGPLITGGHEQRAEVKGGYHLYQP